MSWFNINVNESLNTLKGQISNVSNVMHDVFTEGVLEEHTATTSETTTTTAKAVAAATTIVPPKTVTPSPTSSPNPPIPVTSDDEILIGLEEANKKIDELSSLCETKDNEVSA